MNRYTFYATYPDHSGNVGQFSMGNEPALHIPYLYNYAGEAWRTQKRVRSLLKEWTKSWFTHEDLMNGGVLELEMGRQPNKAWGADEKDLPPSFKMN